MFYVYVIENLGGKRYIGSTADIVDRLKMHNDMTREMAKFHRTTYKRGPWHLLFNELC